MIEGGDRDGVRDRRSRMIQKVLPRPPPATPPVAAPRLSGGPPTLPGTPRHRSRRLRPRTSKIGCAPERSPKPRGPPGRRRRASCYRDRYGGPVSFGAIGGADTDARVWETEYGRAGMAAKMAGRACRGRGRGCRNTERADALSRCPSWARETRRKGDTRIPLRRTQRPPIAARVPVPANLPVRAGRRCPATRVAGPGRLPDLPVGLTRLSAGGSEGPHPAPAAARHLCRSLVALRNGDGKGMPPCRY